MILRDNTEIQGLIEPASNGYLYGNTDRSVIGLAFEQAYKNSITGWAVDKANEKLDAVMGYQQELVSIEEAQNKWGIKLKEPETLSKVRHKARLNSFNKYSDLSQQVAQQSNGTAYNWTSTIGGVLAGSFFDPLLLVASLGVGNLAKAVATSIKPIAKAIYSANPFIKHASRIGIFGGSDVGFNIVTGKIITKNRGQEKYTSADYAFDIALGSIVGTFIGSRMLKAHKIKLDNKLVSPDSVRELPFFDKDDIVKGKFPIEDDVIRSPVVKGKYPIEDDVIRSPVDKGKFPIEDTIIKGDIKINDNFLTEVKELSPADIATSKAIDFYDKMATSGRYNKLTVPEQNIMTFIKANQINGAVNSEYLGRFLDVQESFNGVLKKVYDFIPDDSFESVKTFSKTIEDDIMGIINTISNHTGIPKSLDEMKDKLTPFYKSLTDNGNLFSGKGTATGAKEIADEVIPKLTPEGIDSSVASGLDTIDKVRPFKKNTDVVKPKTKAKTTTNKTEEDVSPVVEALKVDKNTNSKYKISVKSFNDNVKNLDDNGISAFGERVMADISAIPVGVTQDIAVSDAIGAMFASTDLPKLKRLSLAYKFYTKFPNSITMNEFYSRYTKAQKLAKE